MPLDGPCRCGYSKKHGSSHLIAARVQVAMRGYTKLAEAPFAWHHDREYEMQLTVSGSETIGGAEVLRASDNSFGYGMFGVSALDAGRAYYNHIRFTER